MPAAIVAATTHNPEVAGGVYPFPLIEDGDFDIPSVYLNAEEGERLAQLLGATATLTIDAERIPATGCNVVARKLPDAPRRVVVCAHIDAKDGTPGALDNAAGVVVLLLLGELLANYQGELGVELVAINGEDYYSNPGEQRYLADNQGRFDDIVLGVNIDGVGYVEGKTAYSLYECPAAMAALVHQAFAAPDAFVGGEPWVQGDHALFLMNRRPTVAITSEQIMDLLAEIPHTPKDRPELVNCAKLAETAEALYELLGVLGGLRQ